MIPLNETADAPPLSVEHRLLIALALLDSLQRLASHADGPRCDQLFADVPTFARIVWQFARSADTHLRAVRAAMMPEHAARDASMLSGGVQ
jgi:hypothetical protein